MAYRQVLDVRCKNKLYTYEGTVDSYDCNWSSLVCPECGFKTLRVYSKWAEKIAREIERATKDAEHSTLRFGHECGEHCTTADGCTDK